MGCKTSVKSLRGELVHQHAISDCLQTAVMDMDTARRDALWCTEALRKQSDRTIAKLKAELAMAHEDIVRLTHQRDEAREVAHMNILMADDAIRRTGQAEADVQERDVTIKELRGVRAEAETRHSETIMRLLETIGKDCKRAKSRIFALARRCDEYARELAEVKQTTGCSGIEATVGGTFRRRES